MSHLKAILWDVDGTLAETERDGHRVAFNRAFEAHGVPWRWGEAEYGELLRITGGRERILHDLSRRAEAHSLTDDPEALARQLHAAKNRFYAELMAADGPPLRPGVRELMDEARSRGVRMGLTTTTSRSNVDALLRLHLGPRWAESFAVIVCGEDVRSKKPDPEVYLAALAALGLGPLEAVAIEDSPGGVAAAREAGVPVVVTRSAYFMDATIDEAVAIGPGLHSRAGWRPALPGTEMLAEADAGRVTLDDLMRWCEQMDTVSQPA
ncbi:MAG: HAD-IA family hydrolase [Leptothrix sp. (in: b-proteobacteria)]